MDQEKQNRILATLHAILFSLLLTLSVLILRGVVSQFFSEDTTFKIHNGEIDEYPTITLCFTQPKEGWDDILSSENQYANLFGEGSYTYGNDLPGMVRNLASAAGRHNIGQ